MKTLTKIFLKGLFTLLPILFTIYLIYWGAAGAESFLGAGMKLVIPPESYRPGMGIAAGILVVLAFGILLQAWLFRQLFTWLEKLLNGLPLVKSLYSAIKDLLGFFSGGDSKQANQVVMVDWGEPPLRFLGFVTRENFSDLPAGFASDQQVLVYIPMSYQIGGFTLVVPRTAIEPIDMTMEEALRFAVTAGMTTKNVTESKGRTPDPDF